MVKKMNAKNDSARFEMKDKTLFIAREIIVTQGLSALTARRLAKENGFSVGTLYNLFGSIDEIITNIAVTCLSELCEKVETAIMEIDNPDIKLQIFSKTIVDFIEANHHIASLVFSDISNYGANLPSQYNDKVKQLFSHVDNIFMDFFPAINETSRKKLSEVYSAGLMGIMSLSSKKLLSSVCFDSPAAITELLFTMYLAGMKKLNLKSE